MRGCMWFALAQLMLDIKGKAGFLTENLDQGLYTVCNWFIHSDPNISSVCVCVCFCKLTSCSLSALQPVWLSCPTDVCFWPGLIGGSAVYCISCVRVCGLQERGVRSTDCSALRWGPCCTASPALPRWTRPTAAANTAPSHWPHRTHTGRFRGTWAEGGVGWGERRKVNKRWRRTEEEIEKKQRLLFEHGFSLKKKGTKLFKIKRSNHRRCPQGQRTERGGMNAENKNCLVTHEHAEGDAEWGNEL